MQIKKINKEFILESEMIPIIIKDCSKIFKAKFYLQEFQTGNGIPDIVFAKKLKHRYYRKMDYESYYFISETLKQEIIKFERNIISMKKYKDLKDFLLKNKYIKQIDDNTYLKQKNITPLVEDIIAIEAKLSDWKNGFYQALRYKFFAHEVYLAISESKIKNVKIDLLKENGVGLIAVNDKQANVIVYAVKNNPINFTSCLYSSQNIYEKYINDTLA